MSASRDFIRRQFEAATAEHTMTVLRDDGLYRHLRFQKPDSWIYGFDLVTWPGYLAIVGDIGSYVFSRTRDMVDFFAAGPGINPDYWAQKLQAPRGPSGVQHYSHDAFRSRVLDWAHDHCSWDDEMVYEALLVEALEREVLGDHTDSAHEARERLDALDEATGGGYTDSWEWDLRELDHQFVLCCFAIRWGVETYHAAAPPIEAAA